MSFCFRSAASIAAIAAATCFSSAAMAQASPGGVEADTSGTATGDILVTGSRIARPDLESPMPVSVMGMDEARSMGLNTVWDALIREPSVSPGVGRNNAQGQGYDGGTASINLRNMGTNRTLTLVDGRRRVSGSARSSAVDLNMFPAVMIDRIEIITGGAAAIYGADAVTGAVNIITKKDIQGVHMNATTGLSRHGDGRSTSLSLATGAKLFDGRGSVSVGGTYVNSERLRTTDRRYTRSRLLYHTNPDNTSLNDGIPDKMIHYDFGEFYYQNYPTFVRNNVNYGYTGGGVRELFVAAPTNARGEFYGGGGEFRSDIRPLTDGDQLRSPAEQFAVIGRFDYELTDTIQFNARAEYGRSVYEGTKTFYREDSRASWLGGAGSAWAYLDNPYLPDPVRQFMTDNDLTRLRISRAYKEFGLQRDVHKRDSYTLASELSGDLTDTISWGAFAQYGRSIDNVSNPHTLRASRWISARDAIADPVTGAPVCRDAAAQAAGCVPYNIFSNDYPTAGQTDWMFATRREKRVNSQLVFGGNIVGSVFSLPYGDVAVALGAEYRKDKLKTTEDPLAIPSELAHGAAITRHEPIEASASVAEIYGELIVPLLREVPFAHRLEVEGAVRYSDYDTFGGSTTWKAGMTWAPVEGVTFRGVRSRSVRAPNFGELYQPVTLSLSNLEDPCEDPFIYSSETRTNNCLALGIATPGLNNVAQTAVTSGGNPALKPETSNSLTLGVIVQPAFIRGLDITLDYWKIDIDDVITQFGGTQIANYCVDLPNIDNIFCNALTRDPTSPVRAILTASTQQINASNQKAEGLDLGVSYRTPVGEGQLSLSFKGTYLLEKQIEAVPGIEASILQQMTGYADPRFRGTLFANYSIGAFGVSWSSRLHGSAIVDTALNLSDESYDDNTVPAKWYNDLSLRYDINEKFRISAGINNVFDVEPPYMPSTYTGGGGIYDTLGRYFFLSADLRL